MELQWKGYNLPWLLVTEIVTKLLEMIKVWHTYIHFTCNYMRDCIRPQILLSRWGRVWGTNLAQKCPIGIPQSLSSNLEENWSGTGTIPISFMFFFFTVYSLPVITKAWTLVDWCGIYSLNTTNSSILLPKTLLDMVFCLPDPSLPGRKGLRSRQGLYEDSLMWTIYPLYL